VKGPSGSEETTPIRALTSRELLEEDGLSILAGDADVRGRMVIVPQGSAPFDHLAVPEKIRVVLRKPGPSPGRARRGA
jgi:hypothetical protein